MSVVSQDIEFRWNDVASYTRFSDTRFKKEVSQSNGYNLRIASHDVFESDWEWDGLLIKEKYLKRVFNIFKIMLQYYKLNVIEICYYLKTKKYEYLFF